MSLIGLLTATEKQVLSGCCHMRPLQWHLNNHWHDPEVLENTILLPRSLHPHLDWWLDGDIVLQGQPLHSHQQHHALLLFTGASNNGWGTHLGDCTTNGLWSQPERRLHINFLELKAVLLVLKEFEPLCFGQTILLATDNTTVVFYINKNRAMGSGSLLATDNTTFVFYINKKRGMGSGSLCALLLTLLSLCNLMQIVLKARHIPGCLNVMADNCPDIDT